MLETVSDAIKNFEETQKKYREYGAYDSEPDSIFQRLIDAAVKGKGPAIPRDAAGWELYTSTMDCTEAANALHDHALAVVRAIESCPIRDLETLRAHVHKYCWRLY